MDRNNPKAWPAMACYALLRNAPVTFNIGFEIPDSAAALQRSHFNILPQTHGLASFVIHRPSNDAKEQLAISGKGTPGVSWRRIGHPMAGEILKRIRLPVEMSHDRRTESGIPFAFNYLRASPRATTSMDERNLQRAFSACNSVRRVLIFLLILPDIFMRNVDTRFARSGASERFVPCTINSSYLYLRSSTKSLKSGLRSERRKEKRRSLLVSSPASPQQNRESRCACVCICVCIQSDIRTSEFIKTWENFNHAVCIVYLYAISPLVFLCDNHYGYRPFRFQRYSRARARRTVISPWPIRFYTAPSSPLISSPE